MVMDTRKKSFLIEVARHSRAICKKCRQKCVQGSLRLAKLSPNPVGSGTMKTWHHIDCLFELFLKQRKTTKRIEGMHDIEGWELLDNSDKVTILKKIEDCNIAFKAKLDGSSKKKRLVNAKRKQQHSEPCIIEESTCETPETMSTEEHSPEYHHKSFRYFRIVFESMCGAERSKSKSAILGDLFKEGTNGHGFKGDISLWCKMLIPTSAKRKIPFTPERLVQISCEIFGLNVDDKEVKEILESNQRCGRKISTLFKKSESRKPNTEYYLTLQEVDEFLEMLSRAKSEAEKIQYLHNIITKCSANNLNLIVKLILQDFQEKITAKHVCRALDEKAYAMYKSDRNIKAVVDKYWKEPSEEERKELYSQWKRKREKRLRSEAKSQKASSAKKPSSVETKTSTSSIKGEVCPSSIQVPPGTKSPSQAETTPSSLPQAQTVQSLPKGKSIKKSDKHKRSLKSSESKSESSSSKALKHSRDADVKSSKTSVHKSQSEMEVTSSIEAEDPASSLPPKPSVSSSEVEAVPSTSSSIPSLRSPQPLPSWLASPQPGPSWLPSGPNSPQSSPSSPQPGPSYSAPLITSEQIEAGTSSFQAQPGTVLPNRAEIRNPGSPETSHDFIHDGDQIILMPDYYHTARTCGGFTDVELINLAYKTRFFKGVRVFVVGEYGADPRYKKAIATVIVLCGGITFEPSEATHVLHPPDGPDPELSRRYDTRHLIHVSPRWIEDTIERDELQNVDDYLVPVDEDDGEEDDDNGDEEEDDDMDD